ncbi:PAC2 family protein [Lapillicoccus jejuensis]|uniref:Putative ATP-grasp superfamily ATP-dependent carboligase n=1 Tax=Lapillicoccus jejuensis TaxID=402171 RepID=A0A542E6U7_9MICO|nr:PAC2 family protein [Lapillicoccus jejuensis]TQJ11050.1 putative ATP-grasp superfamily ATP-dependent carboligase [Lapillicoccus jejuensis]
MQDPSALYRFETDTHPAAARASVLLVAVGGFVDAGRTQQLMTQHLLDTHEHTVVASFDVDQLLDYRGRRPVMTFDRDRYTSYDDPSLLLYRLVDREGTPFLLLAGVEPDYQWERVVEAVTGLIRVLGVELTLSVHGIPMAVPHTRPIGLTAHATDPRLISTYESVFGAVQVPGSLAALLELRLGESGRDAVGFSVHVPHYLGQAEFPDAALSGLGAVIAATGLALNTEDLAAMAGLNRAQLATEVASSEEVQGVVHALEQQYDAFMEGHRRPSLLATSISELPTADEIGAELEAFLADVDDTRPDGDGGPSQG